MHQDRLAQLEQQLFETQQELRELREELRAARRPVAAARGRWLGGVVLAAALLGAGFFLVAQTEAQAPAAAKAKAAPLTVAAPFKVVDKAGKTILSVEDGEHRGVATYSKSGQRMTTLFTNDSGNGVLETYSSNRSVHSLVGGGKGGLTVFDGSGKMKCEYQSRGMKIYDESENAVLALRSDPATGKFGALVLGKSGEPRVDITAEGDVGMVKVLDSENNSVVQVGAHGCQVMKEGNVVGTLGFSPEDNGAGYLLLCDPAGHGIAEGGMLSDQRGIFRCFPYNPSVGEVLRGTNYIVGSKD